MPRRIGIIEPVTISAPRNMTGSVERLLRTVGGFTVGIILPPGNQAAMAYAVGVQYGIAETYGYLCHIEVCDGLAPYQETKLSTSQLYERIVEKFAEVDYLLIVTGQPWARRLPEYASRTHFTEGKHYFGGIDPGRLVMLYTPPARRYGNEYYSSERPRIEIK